MSSSIPFFCVWLLVSLQWFQDDEEPEGDQYAPDGSYIPRILFIGKKINVTLRLTPFCV